MVLAVHLCWPVGHVPAATSWTGAAGVYTADGAVSQRARQQGARAAAAARTSQLAELLGEGVPEGAQHLLPCPLPACRADRGGRGLVGTHADLKPHHVLIAIKLPRAAAPSLHASVCPCLTIQTAWGRAAVHCAHREWPDQNPITEHGAVHTSSHRKNNLRPAPAHPTPGPAAPPGPR